jgi:flavin-dependent dehydrogenase
MEYLKGVQFRIQVASRHSDMVEIYIKRPYFYWLIPESKNIIRIGVLSKNPYQDLLSFVKEQQLTGEILEKFAGMVPLNHFSLLSKERIFIVGDSAAQVKPLTYGGIYMGMRAAEILCDCIARGELNEYSCRWGKRFGKEIEVALKMRQIFSKLKDEDIEKIFNFIREKTDIIEKKADFENHSLLLWEFLKHPGTSADILSILFKIIKSSFDYPQNGNSTV